MRGQMSGPVFFQQREDHFLDMKTSKLRIFLVTDHLAPQHPQIIAVTAQCAGGEFIG
jgi:hypothetical protein